MKISFNFIKQKDVVLLDDNYSKLKFKNTSYKNVNFKEINFYSLILSIFNFLFKKKKLSFKDIFRKTTIQMYNPKIIITHETTSRADYIKKLFPNVMLIVYQYAFFIHKRFKKKQNYDLFFVNHKKDKDFLIKNKIIDKKKILISGFVKNNERKEYNFKKKNNDLLYISQFTPKYQKYYSKNTSEKVKDLEKYIIKLVDMYSIKNDCRFNIALKFARSDKSKYSKKIVEKEIQYFRSLIKSKIKFSEEDSLSLAQKSKLIITISSNFANELISRGFKVLYLPLDEEFTQNPNYYLPKKNSFNVHREKNTNKIEKKISNLLNLKDKDWKIFLKKSKHFNMKFDKNNKYLKSVIFQKLRSFSKKNKSFIN